MTDAADNGLHDDVVLFDDSLPRPRHKIYETAVVGGPWEDDLALAGAFLRVAELAFRTWSENGPDDGLPVPILYNYRHSIELSLKWLIRTAARCLRRAGNHPAWADASTVEQRLRTHDVKKLADMFEASLDALDVPAQGNRFDQPTRDVLNWLGDQDRIGDLFRYASIGPAKDARPARPTAQYINFYDQARTIHATAVLLHCGASGWLDAFEQDQIDYLSEMASYGP
jgi:hypothetical protein